eukprot:scaffold24027_cov132-Cylindrotheca_fusiformis.AAC.3
MMIWNQKLLYDARFDTGRDFCHRCYEFLILVVVGTAVLYIRPVSYMSATTEHEDMFAFSLCIFLSALLAIGRSIDIKRNAEGDIGAKRSANYEYFWFGTMALFYGAATVVSGLDYFGQHSSHDSSHDRSRFLAGATTTSTSDAYGETNHVPIALLLAGGFFYPVGVVISIMRMSIFKDFVPQEHTVPINIGFFIHRFGEWIMLMLGESVLSLLIVPTQSGDFYKAFFCGILSITILEILHFRSQPHDPDAHALRRSRHGGFVFMVFGQFYSAALIVLGTSYKMILYEYVYEYESSDAHRLLVEEHHSVWEDEHVPPSGRYLASSGPPILDTADRRQRVAHFFCISMALVWLCLDVMLLAHKGFDHNVKRCSETKTMKKIFSLSMAVMRTALIVVAATLSQYVTDPGLLAFLGLIGIILQVMLRVAGSFVFDQENEFEIAACTHNINGPKSLMCKTTLRLKGMACKNVAGEHK